MQRKHLIDKPANQIGYISGMETQNIWKRDVHFEDKKLKLIRFSYLQEQNNFLENYN